MWRRVLLILAGIVLLGLVAFFAAAPAYFDRMANRVTSTAPLPVSPAARTLHNGLVVADLHIDTLLWKRDITRANDRGAVDLPRMQAGNLTLGVFSSVTKTPRGQNYERNSADSDNITLLAIGQLQPIRTWFSLLNRSLWHAEKLNRAQITAPHLRIIRSRRDLEEALAARAQGQPRTLALLSIEGMHNLEGKAENLDVLLRAGYRMGGLVHFFDNELGGSVHGEAKGGLTPFGRQIMRAMEDRGMVVDLAHASPALIADVVRAARRPVLYSHGGVKGTCNRTRNLSDAEVLAIARTGGVIGIGLWPEAVCGDKVEHTARAMRHVRDIAGIQAVALGSDFDGAVPTPIDATSLAALTEALLAEGFSEAEVRAAMGGNVLRVLGTTLPPA